jgi:hypothetical protein
MIGRAWPQLYVSARGAGEMTVDSGRRAADQVMMAGSEWPNADTWGGADAPATGGDA